MNSARTRVWRFLPKYGKEKSLFNWFFHFAKIERGRSKTKRWQKRKTQNVIWTEILVTDRQTDRYTTVIKMCQTQTLFCLFSSFPQHNDKHSTKFDFNWTKHKWCTWDSNPGPQIGRRDKSTGLWWPPKTNNGLTIKPFWLVHQKFQPIRVLKKCILTYGGNFAHRINPRSPMLIHLYPAIS